MGTRKTRQLSTADARRGEVLATAARVFAPRGYYGTSTTEVAKGAGISQSYLYRLFPDKEALFVAVVEECGRLIRERLAEAVVQVGSAEPADVLDAMGDAYAHLIADRDDLLRVLMHANCAASEPVIRAAVQAMYARLVEYVRSASGAPDELIQGFFATGFLCNVVVSIGATETDAPWTRTLLAGIRHY
ncbi:TetR/AcrR family transcriptional regulator [Streptomyces sp. NPDC005408]|uniref:TetR/AcrR family transcriptional regulator n=1 Tax=Streptomyces sp. NPDC005408 TaxID=3155341 RepID=UPI0033B3B005